MNQSDEKRAELLSAHFDGELESDEQSQARAVLSEWDEGASTLKAYREIHEEFEQLPVRKPSVDLCDLVLDQIQAEQAAQPASSHRTAALAIAAAVVAAVIFAVVSFLPDTKPAETAKDDNEHSAPKGVDPNRLAQSPKTPDGKQESVEPAPKEFVAQPAKGRLQFVIEVVIPAGGDRKILEECLKRCGIRIDARDAIPVEGDLDKAMRESEYFAERIVVKPKADQTPPEFVFLVAGPTQVMETWEFLQSNRGRLRSRFNMVSVTNQNMFAELRKAGEQQWKSTLAQGEELKEGINRASRLVWNVAVLLSAKNGLAAPAAVVRSDTPLPKPTASSSSADSSSPPSKPKRTGDLNAMNLRLFGKNVQFEILFVVHRE